jgi:GABA permease
MKGDANDTVDSQLQIGLKRCHMTIIAIAGVIGAGLFVGSGALINTIGPGAVLSYALAGLLVIFIMRMLNIFSYITFNCFDSI